MAVRLQLANEVEDEVVQEDVEFDYDDLECSHHSGQSVSVDWARGSLSELVTANTYEFDNADNADLVVASFEPLSIRSEAVVKVEGEAGYAQSTLPFVMRGYEHGKRIIAITPEGYRNVWKELAKDDDADYVNDGALLALDVRNMEPHAVNLLSTVARISGVDDADINAMRLRAELELDPDTPPKQMSLPFKPNSSEAHEIMTSLEETKELRASLDWKRLSALP
jgi:hypothetical protein